MRDKCGSSRLKQVASMAKTAFMSNRIRPQILASCCPAVANRCSGIVDARCQVIEVRLMDLSLRFPFPELIK